MKRPLVVGLTGASGVVYGIRLIDVLLELGHTVYGIVSFSARLVLQEEMGVSSCPFTKPEHFRGLLSHRDLTGLHVFAPNDLLAPIASGSYPIHGMAVVPCSMGSLGAIASGYTHHLIHRAADCALKEGRPLVLVPRETPLHAGHLEHMLKLAQRGAKIVPAMPGFYGGAKTVQDLVDFIVGKVLDQLGITHSLYPRWIGKSASWEVSQ